MPLSLLHPNQTQVQSVMQTNVMLLHPRIQVKLHLRSHRNLKLLSAILNELVNLLTCMVIDLCTIILFSVNAFWLSVEEM